jgi:sec-independent protein translocase protein TatB
MCFLFLEFLGTTELMVIAFVALIIFGPRKLPELGRSLGRSLGEFKRASEDFKRTWEYEVEMERTKPETSIEHESRAARGLLREEDGATAAEFGDENVSPRVAAATREGEDGQTIARARVGSNLSSTESAAPAGAAVRSEAAAEPDGSEPVGDEVSAPARKQDWL